MTKRITIVPPLFLERRSFRGLSGREDPASRCSVGPDYFCYGPKPRNHDVKPGIRGAVLGFCESATGAGLLPGAVGTCHSHPASATDRLQRGASQGFGYVCPSARLVCDRERAKFSHLFPQAGSFRLWSFLFLPRLPGLVTFGDRVGPRV